jgi:hypothetical protein
MPEDGRAGRVRDSAKKEQKFLGCSCLRFQLEKMADYDMVVSKQRNHDIFVSST